MTNNTLGWIVVWRDRPLVWTLRRSRSDAITTFLLSGWAIRCPKPDLQFARLRPGSRGRISRADWRRHRRAGNLATRRVYYEDTK